MVCYTERANQSILYFHQSLETLGTVRDAFRFNAHDNLEISIIILLLEHETMLRDVSEPATYRSSRCPIGAIAGHFRIMYIVSFLPTLPLFLSTLAQTGLLDHPGFQPETPGTAFVHLVEMETAWIFESGDMNLSPSSASQLLFYFRQITSPLWAFISFSEIRGLG